jgi:hypothetical protein
MAVLPVGVMGLWLHDEGDRRRFVDDTRTAIKRFEISIRSERWFSR